MPCQAERGQPGQIAGDQITRTVCSQLKTQYSQHNQVQIVNNNRLSIFTFQLSASNYCINICISFIYNTSETLLELVSKYSKMSLNAKSKSGSLLVEEGKKKKKLNELGRQNYGRIPDSS